MSRFVPYLLAIGAVAFASVAGYFAASALGVGTQAPQITTTVDIGTGSQGPTGPQGVPGAPGAESCPTGTTFGKLVINAPKGQVSILTCIVN